MRRFLMLSLLVLGFSFSYSSLALAASTQPSIRIFDKTGLMVKTFSPYTNHSALIESVASADLGKDGTDEIIIGAGEDQDAKVFIYRQDGSMITSFLAYNLGYRGGVNIAACDVDGDGVKDIVTGAAWNGGPHIKIFDNMGKEKSSGFMAFDQTFTGGINVTCGDIDNNGVSEIIVGAGLGGGPNVKIFSKDGKLKVNKFVDDAKKNTGAKVLFRDGVIYTQSMDETLPMISLWKYDSTTSSIVSVPNVASINPFTTINVNKNGINVGLVTADVAVKMNSDRSAKSILIDISQQRLTAYEYGVPMHTFLVSTAKNGWATPLGKTSVMTKLLYHDYKWGIVNGATYDYYIPNVKWNLRIYKHIYIHWAWWHNKYGQPVSQGCINADKENAQRLFEWSEVGTPVEIRK